MRMVRQITTAASLSVSLIAATPAHATPLPMESAAAIVAAALQASNVCVHYDYDANGNRTSRTVEEIAGTGTTWGTGVYGCFLWSA